MQIGLSFDEFVNVKLRPSAGADPAFLKSFEIEVTEMFPMTSVMASNHLRSRGYDCRPVMLEHLTENDVVTLSQPDTWSRQDVDTAADYFEQCEIYVPYAAMCQALGCRYVDFLSPLREAAERESQKYGRHVPDNDQYFVMHRVPPRGVTNAQGELVEVTPSVISFTLCDDIRERLERGEEV